MSDELKVKSGQTDGGLSLRPFRLVRVTIASTFAGWLIGVAIVSICFGRALDAGFLLRSAIGCLLCVATPFACAALVVRLIERDRRRPTKSTGASGCCRGRVEPINVTVAIGAAESAVAFGTVAVATCPVCAHRTRSTVLHEIGDLANEDLVELFACDRCGALIAEQNLGPARHPTPAELRAFRRELPRSWDELERKQRDWRNRLRRFGVVSSQARSP